jgi:hypothetical protein
MEIWVVFDFWNAEFVQIKIILGEEVLQMEQLLRSVELARVLGLLVSEPGVAGWLEQGLKSDDAAVEGVVKHLSLDELSIYPCFDPRITDRVQDSLAIETNTVFFGEIFELRVNELVNFNLLGSKLLTIDVVLDNDMNIMHLLVLGGVINLFTVSNFS